LRHTVLALIVAFAGASGARSATLELTRVGDRIPIGTVVGKISTGDFCVKRGDLTWQQAAKAKLAATAPVLQIAFREAVGDAGLGITSKADDLFATSSTNPDFQIGALLTGLSESICFTATVLRRNSAEATMSIEWQVYSVSAGKIVSRISTSASSQVSGAPSSLEETVERAVFLENAKRLLQAPELQTLLATEVPTPSRTTLPAGELRLEMPQAKMPVPLADAARAAVTILTSDGFGSGVLISRDGYILTNRHVVGDAGHLRIRWASGAESVGNVVRSDLKRDVALVRVTPIPEPPITLRQGPATLGETVYAIGTPREREFAGTLTRGVVSQPDRVLQGQHFIQSDVSVTHGNSGGPLFDEKGWLIGIAQSGYEPEGVSQNINFFIPIDEALSALGVKPAG
jgi:serine protease Do